ncbi:MULTISPECIES: PspC domain-containing protein [Alteromonadaceae]|jgi:phage shock protein C|uniref:PspC domain-containing protein n=1 Tax=Brumicola blandensis TaxID=3075611 RepID=A0AAW8R8Q1_9ALTE|nr:MULTISPECIES: PspC domain-containing protein [unclassified Alteromonas]MDT0584220.1 PspC domain-containing protein [Alteromonas sp. W409]MDT0629673.1 PspC domain-containing protein [Alteromonas sp. W364]
MKTVINDRRLFRDPSRAIISGVCAGLAKYFDVNPLWVRVAAVASMAMLPFATALAYVLAILLLRYK